MQVLFHGVRWTLHDAAMSNHSEKAEELLGRAPDVDHKGDQQIPYLLAGALVHALLDVAAALRRERS